jgi:hypothetical protein
MLLQINVEDRIFAHLLMLIKSCKKYIKKGGVWELNELNITICGCGNGAHACAALLSKKGHIVNIYSPITSEVELFKTNYEKSNGLTLRIGVGLLAGLGKEGNSQGSNPKEEIFEGLKINKVTDKAEDVIPDSSIIIVIVPSFAHRNILNCIKEYVSKNCLLVFLPSRGGIEFEVNSIMPNTNIVAFQTLPWACRIKTFGSEINMSGIKNRIQAASMPSDISPVFIYELEQLLGLKIDKLKNIVTLTLANVGQIFHPGIMYGIFKNNPEATFKEEDIPLFYQNVNEEIANILSSMSEEIRSIAYELSKVNEDIECEKVLHIRDWLLSAYEGIIEDTSSLHRMFYTNGAYTGVKAPTKKLDNGMYAPDFGARYIVEDIPYGLLITRSIAEILNVKTPVIDEVLGSIGKWVNYDYLGNLKYINDLSNKSRLPEFYGVNSIEKLKNHI